jgi:N-hydroxyarylamine O-acetyltransferase
MSSSSGVTVMDDATVGAYLQRIGAALPERPDSAALRDLQERHLMSVPFENIDFHLGIPIQPEDLGDTVVDKVVRRRRGGRCRELNGATFPALLQALGFTVTLLGARVFDGDRLGIVLGHTALQVDTDEPWLVDVGFGRGSRYPLRFDVREPQEDPQGRFQLVDAPYGDVDLYRDGVPLYRVEMRPRRLEDFRPVLWWYETSPDSPLRDQLFCSLVTPTGRVTLNGNVVHRFEAGQHTEEVLETEDEVREAYRVLFGIALDRLPALPRKASRQRVIV